MGETGKPLSDLLSTKHQTIGFDLDPKRCERYNPDSQTECDVLNICFGFSETFVDYVKFLIERFRPKIAVIHSTVKPGTTRAVQTLVDVPVFYSPIRGVHKTMSNDMLFYTKYFALYPHSKMVQAVKDFRECFSMLKLGRMETPLVLEYAKILADTTYYGVLIAYAQYVKKTCVENGLDYNELWEFAKEIHQKRGDRPILRPGFIGGHCVIPNAKLIGDDFMAGLIDSNLAYGKYLEEKGLNQDGSD
jgi:UDP-N-acetyl-D-mannosaminuronate dehydrogenase